MPAIPLSWMDPTVWQKEPLDWATYAYHLLAPKVNVKGRIALLLLFAIIWAFSWLLWRAYSVIQTPNDVLVDKLGLNIPPTPYLALEEITSNEARIAWKMTENLTQVQEFHVEVNGRIAGITKKAENSVAISNLLPSTLYDVRVFSVSAGRFQTPSALLHIKTRNETQQVAQDDTTDQQPFIRVVLGTSQSVVLPSSAPAMARELSGGHPISRRGTVARRVSPASHNVETATANIENNSRSKDDEVDGNLVELSQSFQKIQQDIEAAEAQIQEEEAEFEGAIKELEARRDELKHSLKERDEASGDLRKQVHKAETASRTAINEKAKKEKLLQQKENQRRKRRDEIAKWEDQIASMKEEMAAIETQKAAVERRAQSDIREVREKIEEEQREVTTLEEENKEKTAQIKALEEERQQLNVDDETEESREADRLEHERSMRWRERYYALNSNYTRLWNELQQAQMQFSMATQRLTMYESVRRQNTVTFAPAPPIDLDTQRRATKGPRRSRHTGSHSSNISSPRAPFAPEQFNPGNHFINHNSASPTAFGQSYFNPQNGMTILPEVPAMVVDDSEPNISVPMSPRADALLPADLLDNEFNDDLPEDDIPMPTKPTIPEGKTSPFRKFSSPTVKAAAQVDSPSGGSSSGRSFSSPRESFAQVQDPDRRSMHSGHLSIDQTNADDGQINNTRKLANLFNFSRARGKTLVDQGPLLGSLKTGQTQSYPRNLDEFVPGQTARRRGSYGASWAFPGSLMARGNAEKGSDRLSGTKRAFPGLLSSFGKTSATVPPYDPFNARSGSLDPGYRDNTSSPRPASTYSFDKLNRPSLEGSFNVWNVDKPLMRNSPLAGDWASLHSFSRAQSRRPSIHYRSTSNLSLGGHIDEDIVEPRGESKRPSQPPIGTPATPKLNPAAPSFTMLFGKHKDKNKDKGRAREPKDFESGTPPDSRKSREAPSIAPTTSTVESRDSRRGSLDRTTSAHSSTTPVETTPQKPTFISKIARKASTNKFGSWKDKGGIFSRKDASTPTCEADDEHLSTEHFGKVLDSTTTIPSADEKKASRTSLTSWNFMRKNKKGKDDLTASEVSESSERASEAGDDIMEEEY